ncbi:MAG: hypothetical protein J1E62_04560 [Lachnospiraceae bacterium]|nr:hypothetical protein [Lachnospiraceae bacterium]
MHSKTTNEMIRDIVGEFINYFGGRVSEFSVGNDLNGDSQQSSFHIIFKAYNYFPMQFHYDNGEFGCCILTDEDMVIELELSQKHWESTDFNRYLKELKEEIELRIPDKFLRARGWL